MRWIGFAAMLLLGAACGGCTRQSSPASGEAQEVTYRDADGWVIHATYTPAAGARGAVVLLHQRGGSRSDWEPLVPKLNAAHIATLAIDQRGAGDSAGPQNGDAAPWDTSPDIAGAIQWQATKGFQPGAIALVGASYGANNALIYSAANPGLAAIVLLSPCTNYNGLAAAPPARTEKSPALILWSRDDSIMEGGPDTIRQALPRQPDTAVYSGSAHGTAIFSADAPSLDTITRFLVARVGPGDGSK